MASPQRGNADFAKVWFGQTLSVFGDRVSKIAIPTIAILLLDGDAFDVGLLVALGAAPFLFVSPFAGVWVDRVPRRSVMIAADVGRLVLLGSIPLAAALDLLTMGQLYLVAVLCGVLTVFFQVAIQSYLPTLVGREHVMAANSRLQTTSAASEVAGAASGGAIIQALGAAFAVVVDAATFLVSTIAVVLVRHREPARPRSAEARPAVLGELREGLRTLLGDGRLRSLMSSSGLINAGSGIVNAVLLVFAYTTLGLRPLAVGIAVAVGGVGLIAGAIAARPVAMSVGIGPALITAVGVSGVTYLVLPLAAPGAGAIVVLAACQLVFGLTQSVYHVHVMSLVQGITPGHLLGRVNGSAVTVVYGGTAVGAVIGALVGGATSPRVAIVVGGLLVLLGALVLFSGPIRAIRRPVAADPAPAGPGAGAQAHGETSALEPAEPGSR